MATFIKGDVLILSIHDGSAYRPIACLTSNSLSESMGVIETITKCDPGVTQKAAGTYSYDISAEGEYIDTTSVGAEITKASHDYMHSIFAAGAEINWKMATGIADTSDYFGAGYLTELSADAPTGDEFATFSMTLSGNGSIVTTDPVA